MSTGMAQAENKYSRPSDSAQKNRTALKQEHNKYGSGENNSLIANALRMH